MTTLVRLFSVIVASLLAMSIPVGSRSASARERGPEYYYNAGRRVPVGRSSTRVALVVADESARAQLVADAGAVSSIRSARDVRTSGAVELTVDDARALPAELRDLAQRAGSGVVPVFFEPGVERDASTLLITDEVLVQFSGDVAPEDVDELIARAGAGVIEPLRYAPNGFRLRVNSSDLDRNALTVANDLYETGRCLWSHPNFLASRRLSFVPNDPLYTNQWHLRNTGQGGGTVGADAKAEPAWDVTLGSTSITVAICDTGINWHHSDLEVTVDGVAKIVAPRDVVHGDNDPFPGPNDANISHGTSCSGVSVAATNNGVNVAGMAPKCRLMPIQLYAESTFTPNATEADAFTWAADNGADVMSNSWGPDNADTPLPDATRAAMDYATDTGRGGKGMAIFFAAGNENFSTNRNNYANYARCIAIAASTNFDTKAGYSNFGPAISVAACSNGGSLGITTLNHPSATTSGFGGTSSACPLAAGVAALVLSVNPNLTWRQLKSVLEQSADKIDTAGGAYNALGRSDKYGYGRVNAQRAVALAVAGGPDTVGLYSTGTYFLRDSNSGGPANAAFGFGPAGAFTPLAGDWDGNGTSTIGFYNPTTATFFLRNANTPGPADLAFSYGPAGAVPVVGDWDGNGTTTVGVYIPVSGAFFLRNANTPGPADLVFTFGPSGSSLSAVAGDWNNDGIDTIGLYSQTSGAFFLKNANTPGSADLTFTYGAGGLLAISGDWDNDGTDSVGLYDASTGGYFLRNQNSPGPADWTFSFGAGGATPLSGNWDGF